MKPTTLTELKAEISRREAARPQIRERIAAFMKEKFGISNFWKIVDNFFQGQEGFGLCLARQIPTSNIEHVGLALLCEWLQNQGFKCEFSPLALYADSYIGGNDYKESLVKIPWVMDRRKRPGEITQQTEKLLQKSEIVGTGYVFSQMQHHAGTPLTEHHLQLLGNALGYLPPVRDISPYFRLTAQLALGADAPRKPDEVYVTNGTCRERLVRATQLEDANFSRPRARWYYFIYLLVLVDGHRGLLSTVDDCDDVTGWFDDAIREIEEICGFQPLIIDVPVKVVGNGYESFLNEHSLRVQQGDWRKLISQPSPESTIFDAAEHFQKSILTLPKLRSEQGQQKMVQTCVNEPLPPEQTAQSNPQSSPSQTETQGRI